MYLCIAVSLYYCYHLSITLRHEKDFTTVICYHPNYFQQVLNMKSPKETVKVTSY